MRRVAALAALALALAAPAAADDATRGRDLYAAECARCHGSAGEGTPTDRPSRDPGPSLRGVGALAADFELRTGYMPLVESDDQPSRHRPRYSDAQIDALVAYVASLGDGPSVPEPHPARGSLSEGFHLFTERCAGCHQIAGEGGVVTGARVPSLEHATPVQIAEAVRLGPYLMPRFGPRAVSDAQLDSVIRYVLRTRHPTDAGGWGLGHVGPIPEGMVTWLLAAVALVGVSTLIGRRLHA
jgi:ubiquinol-cytochrome c reductase cytochrome c subunit